MSGIERPDPADLLETARRLLLDDIMPALDGPARYKALMIANAMAIAARAARAEPIAEFPHAASICADIRAGRYDDDSTLAQRLLAYAEARCRISSKAP
jgi:hypothetical protein